MSDIVTHGFDQWCPGCVFFIGSATLVSGASVPWITNLRHRQTNVTCTYFSTSKNRPKYSLVFLAFGAEELGLLGSKYFVDHPPFALKNIKFLLNFDLAGTGSKGIQVVNATTYPNQFKTLQTLNQKQRYVKEIKARGHACNSDHCSFDSFQVPSFYSYTLGGIAAYHDVYDRFETLPLTSFEGYASLMKAFVKSF